MEISLFKEEQEQNKESRKFLGNSISLLGICYDENINNDTKLLEEVTKNSALYETSSQFVSCSNQFKTKYEKTRRSIKKIIQDKNSFSV